MYTAIIPPEMCAIPLPISASSSDRVIRGTNGFTMSGASVWPMNTFAETESVSAPLVPMRYIIARAMIFTKNCSTPR